MPLITHSCKGLDPDIKGVVIFKTEDGETTCYCNACKKEFVPCYKEEFKDCTVGELTRDGECRAKGYKECEGSKCSEFKKVE